MDVVHFLTSSTAPAFQKANLDALLKYYHNGLMKELAVFGYNDTNLYTYENLLADYNECFTFGLVVELMNVHVS